MKKSDGETVIMRRMTHPCLCIAKDDASEEKEEQSIEGKRGIQKCLLSGPLIFRTVEKKINSDGLNVSI